MVRQQIITYKMLTLKRRLKLLVKIHAGHDDHIVVGMPPDPPEQDVQEGYIGSGVGGTRGVGEWGGRHGYGGRGGASVTQRPKITSVPIGMTRRNSFTSCCSGRGWIGVDRMASRFPYSPDDALRSTTSTRCTRPTSDPRTPPPFASLFDTSYPYVFCHPRS